MKLETGQVWRQYGKDFGDLSRFQVVFVKGINAIVMNCATLKQTVIYGQGQFDSFTFDCELTNEKPSIDQETLNRAGFGK